MNVMNYLDYNSVSDIRNRLISQTADGAVYKKENNVHSSPSENNINIDNIGSSVDTGVRQNIISTDKIIGIAVNKDMKVDKELIGSKANIEDLDITKVISSAKKDSLLNEYKSFVQNPVSEDGIVIKRMRNNIYE